MPHTDPFDLPLAIDPRVLAMVEALTCSPLTPKPPVPSMWQRCSKVFVVWLIVFTVAIGIGFQIDPTDSGGVRISSWFAIPAGMMVALIATWLGFGVIHLIKENPDSYFLPGESKLLLKPRKLRLLNRLRMSDLKVELAVSLWLRQGDIFGDAQLDALLSAGGFEKDILEKKLILSALKERFLINLLFFFILLIFSFLLWTTITPEATPFSRWACVLMVGMLFICTPWHDIYRFIRLQKNHEVLDK